MLKAALAEGPSDLLYCTQGQASLAQGRCGRCGRCGPLRYARRTPCVALRGCRYQGGRYQWSAGAVTRGRERGVGAASVTVRAGPVMPGAARLSSSAQTRHCRFATSSGVCPSSRGGRARGLPSSIGLRSRPPSICIYCTVRSLNSRQGISTLYYMIGDNTTSFVLHHKCWIC